MSEHLKQIGYNDIDGNPIHAGDVVEFYFDADLGYSDVPDTRYTRMREMVEEHDGKFYFMCGVGGAFAHRHNQHCRVIGRDKNLVDT